MLIIKPAKTRELRHKKQVKPALYMCARLEQGSHWNKTVAQAKLIAQETRALFAFSLILIKRSVISGKKVQQINSNFKLSTRRCNLF